MLVAAFLFVLSTFSSQFVRAQAILDNPQPGSFQSGIGIIHGWACNARRIEIVFNDDTINKLQASYGTSRIDTIGVCGDANNGFGLLFNWSLLGDGSHTIRVLADGVEFARSTFTVTSLGVEFLTGTSDAVSISDFPTPGAVVTLRWQEALQNFVIAGGRPRGSGGTSGSPPRVLENPSPGSFQSGIGPVTGWVCDATTVEIVLDSGESFKAHYGTSRGDTQGVCGDTNNGFGLLINWNLLGDGPHTIRALADGVEFARSTFTVTTLGHEFLKGASGDFALPDFPQGGITTVVRWQEFHQNFVIISMDETFSEPTENEMVLIGGVEREAAKNEILVFLDEDVSSEEIHDIRSMTLAEGGTIRSLNTSLRTIQVGITDATSEELFINAVSKTPGVSGADVNAIVELDRDFVTTNSEGYNRWASGTNRAVEASAVLDAVPSPTSVSFDGDYWVGQIDAPEAWRTLSEVRLDPNTIGIVDTGVSASQNVLAGSRIERYEPHGSSIFGDDTEKHKDGLHGLNVTGYAAGYNNRPVRRGVNPHSRVVFIDVFSVGPDGSFYVTSILQSIKTAINKGASVVNVSWGDPSKCSDNRSIRINMRQNFRNSLNGAVAYARQKDALLVFSAGNNCEKQDDRLLPEASVSYADSWRSHTLIVGASTNSQADACFSRMGDVVNIMAPGQSVGYGAGVANGTSFAAPMVTGAAGLIQSIEETLSAEETRSLLLDSSLNVVSFNSEPTNLNLCSGAEPTNIGAADTPRRLLNVGSAVESALVAADIKLETMSPLVLSKGQRESVTIDVTVPGTGVNALDLVFLIDQSGSYNDDIDTLQARASEIVENLASGGIDIQFGVAGFADFPTSSYGFSGDVPYRLHQRITSDTDSVIAAINQLDNPLMNGADVPESQYEALYRTATEIGWRSGTLRVVLLATDADFHDSDTEPGYPGTGRRSVLAALREGNIVVVGLQSGGGGDAEEHLAELAEATGGSVQSLDAASSEIVAAITTALGAALAETDVTLQVLAGNSWVANISPKVHENIEGGRTVSFTVTVEGQRKRSVDNLDYNVYLWSRGDGSALLSRTKLPIRVPG